MQTEPAHNGSKNPEVPSVAGTVFPPTVNIATPLGRFNCYGTRFTAQGSIMQKNKQWFWSKEDVRTLKLLARQKTPAPKIAKHLGRPIGAVRQKALGLEISLNSRP
jgi:hypothetical protein